MQPSNADIDVKNLCSRKLWELLRDPHTAHQLKPAIEAELLARSHYVAEVQQFKQYRGTGRSGHAPGAGLQQLQQ